MAHEILELNEVFSLVLHKKKRKSSCNEYKVLLARLYTIRKHFHFNILLENCAAKSLWAWFFNNIG